MTEISKIKKVAVLGAGLMGNGIAQVMAQAGYAVSMMDVAAEALDRGFESIKKSLGRMQKKGTLDEDETGEVLGRIKGTLDLREAAGDADFVVEAIPEDLDLKKETFKQVDEICPPHTVLATNTSTMSITAIASVTKRADKVIGMHFANPVPVMKGVVLNIGMDTSKETIEIAKQISNSIGKQYTINRDSPGFAGNRLMPLYVNEAFNVVWEHIATPEDVDKDFTVSFRHPMGPLELADLVGLDQLLNGLEYMHKEWGDKYLPSPLLKQLVSAGYYGRKTGRGIYTYDKSGRKLMPEEEKKVGMPRVHFVEGMFTEADGGVLLANKCKDCGKVFFPKRHVCAGCGASDMDEVLLRDGAKLYTYTTVQMPIHKYKPPFTLGWVEFPEGVRVMSQIKDWDKQPLKIGMEMKLVIDTLWEEETKEVIGYKFQPVA
jgi:3-hydroxybutyryl-CoA dehydrogenase